MTKEYVALKGRPRPYANSICPKCGGWLTDFMRGMVQSGWRRLLRMKYCAVICPTCKEIVGWEKP